MALGKRIWPDRDSKPQLTVYLSYGRGKKTDQAQKKNHKFREGTIRGQEVVGDDKSKEGMIMG